MGAFPISGTDSNIAANAGKSSRKGRRAGHGVLSSDGAPLIAACRRILDRRHKAREAEVSARACHYPEALAKR